MRCPVRVVKLLNGPRSCMMSSAYPVSSILLICFHSSACATGDDGKAAAEEELVYFEKIAAEGAWNRVAEFEFGESSAIVL